MTGWKRPRHRPSVRRKKTTKKNQRQDWKHVWINAEYRAATYLLIDLMWKVNSGGVWHSLTSGGFPLRRCLQRPRRDCRGVEGRSHSLPPRRYLLKSFPPHQRWINFLSWGGRRRLWHGPCRPPGFPRVLIWRTWNNCFIFRWRKGSKKLLSALISTRFLEFPLNFKSTTFRQDVP